MQEKILEILSQNYSLKSIKNLSLNKDGANSVYIITLFNERKLIGKLYTSDEPPSQNVLQTINIFSQGCSVISSPIKNNQGNFITILPEGLSFIVSNFVDGDVVGDSLISVSLSQNISYVLSGLHKYKTTNFELDSWHITTSKEIEEDIRIETDLSKCRISLVHGDLNHLNILTKNQELSGIIDWDGLHKDYLVTDLAIFTAHNLLKSGSKVLVSDFLSDYQKYSVLTTFDLELFDQLVFLRIKQIVKMLKKRLENESNEIIRKYIKIWENKNNLFQKYLDSKLG